MWMADQWQRGDAAIPLGWDCLGVCVCLRIYGFHLRAHEYGPFKLCLKDDAYTDRQGSLSL